VASQAVARQKLFFKNQHISQGALERARAQFHADQAQVKPQQVQTRVTQTQTGFFSVRAHLNGVVFDVLQLLSAVWVPFGLLGSKLIGTPALSGHDLKLGLDCKSSGRAALPLKPDRSWAI
jgi:hypothetical protein